MRERLKRCLINLGRVGRRGSRGALGRYITRHGMRVPHASWRMALSKREQLLLASEILVGIISHALGIGAWNTEDVKLRAIK